MRNILFIVVIVFGFIMSGQANPLAGFDKRWNDERFLQCNTAAGESYLSREEKEVIWILNMMRTDPALFVETVLPAYPALIKRPELFKSTYYASLKKDLGNLAPLNLLLPDATLYPGAACHAEETGKAGIMGHTRKTADCKTKMLAQGECCTYGSLSPIEIVADLLIDDGVANLGHRKLLMMGFKKINVAIRPHKTYELTSVIELKF